MEQAIINAIALIRFPTATMAAKAITFVGEWWALLIAVFVLCLVLTLQKRIREAFAFGAGYAALLILVYSLKELIHRSRPTGGLIEDSLFSFPSAHAALSAYFFNMVAFLFAARIQHPTVRKISTAILFATPLVVAFTRLYLGVHFLTDILSGLFLGGAMTLCAVMVSRYDANEKKDIRSLYTKYWRLYLAMIAISGHRRSLKRYFETHDILRPKMKVVDAGCGAGALTQALWQISEEQSLKDIEFSGFDLTLVMLHRFQQWMDRHNVSGIDISQADILRLSTTDRFEHADLVVSSGMLEYLPKERLVDGLASLRDILKPNGRIVVFISRQGRLNRLFIGKFWRANLYSDDELLTSFHAAGFSNVSIGRFKSWGYAIEARKK